MLLWHEVKCLQCPVILQGPVDGIFLRDSGPSLHQPLASLDAYVTLRIGLALFIRLLVRAPTLLDRLHVYRPGASWEFARIKFEGGVPLNRDSFKALPPLKPKSTGTWVR